MIELLRIEKAEDATYGVLRIDGKTCCMILERPWLNNKRSVSCIPDGIYVCRRINSPSFGETFEVMNVPSRTHILFHSGNTIDDSKGCMLFGTGMGILNGKRGVVNSRKARAEFMKLMKGEEFFPLNIRTI